MCNSKGVDKNVAKCNMVFRRKTKIYPANSSGYRSACLLSRLREYARRRKWLTACQPVPECWFPILFAFGWVVSPTCFTLGATYHLQTCTCQCLPRNTTLSSVCLTTTRRAADVRERILCSSRDARRRGSHKMTPEKPKRKLWVGHGLEPRPQFHEETSERERTKFAAEKGKKPDILGSPPLRPPTLRARHPSRLHPSAVPFSQVDT